MGWMGLFTAPGQTIELLSPNRLLTGSVPLLLRKPAVLLLSNDLWKLSKQKIMQQYPDATIYYISGDRKQIAVEL